MQNMSKEEYAQINNVPSTTNDKRSLPVENDNGFTPITREEMGFGGGLPKKMEPGPAPAPQRNIR